MSDTPRTVVDVTIAAPLDLVWRAIRDPDEIRRWFGWDYDALAAEIDVIFIAGVQELPASTTADGREVRTLQLEGGDAFYVEARGSRTRVRLVRSAPLGQGDWTGIYDDVDEGWTTFVQQLAFAFERHPGAERRTIYLSGHAGSADVRRPIEALGLGGLTTQAPGSAWQASLPTGEVLNGEVVFRSPHQLGLSVASFGDGLLILAHRPGHAKSPHGGGSALLTTYALDPVTLAALRARWVGWWQGAYSRVTVMPE